MLHVSVVLHFILFPVVAQGNTIIISCLWLSCGFIHENSSSNNNKIGFCCKPCDKCDEILLVVYFIYVNNIEFDTTWLLLVCHLSKQRFSKALKFCMSNRRQFCLDNHSPLQALFSGEGSFEISPLVETSKQITLAMANVAINGPLTQY